MVRITDEIVPGARNGKLVYVEENGDIGNGVEQSILLGHKSVTDDGQYNFDEYNTWTHLESPYTIGEYLGKNLRTGTDLSYSFQLSLEANSYYVVSLNTMRSVEVNGTEVYKELDANYDYHEADRTLWIRTDDVARQVRIDIKYSSDQAFGYINGEKDADGKLNEIVSIGMYKCFTIDELVNDVKTYTAHLTNEDADKRIGFFFNLGKEKTFYEHADSTDHNAAEITASALYQNYGFALAGEQMYHNNYDDFNLRADGRSQLVTHERKEWIMGIFNMIYDILDAPDDKTGSITVDFTKYEYKRKRTETTEKAEASPKYSYVGDPVDLTTGAFTDDRTLLSCAGNDPLSLKVNYYSLAAENGNIPGGYTHNWDNWLVDNGDTISFYQGINNEIKFIVNDTYTDGNHFIGNNRIYNKWTATRNDIGYSIVDDNGNTLSFDANGILQSIVKFSGNIITFEYTDDKLSKVSNSYNQNLNFVYDDNGNLSSVTDNINRKITFAYENGILSAITLADDSVLKYSYVEGFDNFIERIMLNDEVVVINEYDELGRVHNQYDSDDSQPMVYTYTSANGDSHYAVQYGQANETDTFYYSYDANGNILTKTDNNTTAKTTFKYDSTTGRLLSITDDFSTSTFDEYGRIIDYTDKDKVSTKYTYVDNRNRILTKTDNDGNVFKNVYDNDKLVQSFFNDTLMASIEYDLIGNVTKYTNRDSYTAYTYDENGYLASIDENGYTTNKYTCDAIGRITNATVNGDEYVIAYDVNSNQLSVSRNGEEIIGNEFDVFGRYLSNIDNERGQKTTFTYNASGNVATQVNTDGETLTYNYDTYSHKLSGIQNSEGTTVYSYAYGYPLSITEVDGTKTRYQYTKGILSHIFKNSGDVQFDINYALYGSGRIKNITVNSKVIATFVYDTLGRLSTTTYFNGVVQTYSYDTFSNLIGIKSTMNDTVIDEQVATYVDSSSKLQSINDVSYTYDMAQRLAKGSGVYTFDEKNNIDIASVLTKDNNGNIINIDDKSFEYNAKNQLTSNGTTYDVRELLKNVNNVGIHYDIFNRLMFDDNGLLYIWGVNGIIGTYDMDTKEFVIHLHDVRGNTVLMIDNGGAAIEETKKTYNDFGDYTSIADNRLNNSYSLGFGGEYGAITDENTELVNLKSRWYNHAIMRFMTMDSVFGNVSNSLTLNRYTYCQNDAINYIDPIGHAKMSNTKPIGANFDEDANNILNIASDILTPVSIALTIISVPVPALAPVTVGVNILSGAVSGAQAGLDISKNGLNAENGYSLFLSGISAVTGGTAMADSKAIISASNRINIGVTAGSWLNSKIFG